MPITLVTARSHLCMSDDIQRVAASIQELHALVSAIEKQFAAGTSVSISDEDIEKAQRTILRGQDLGKVVQADLVVAEKQGAPVAAVRKLQDDAKKLLGKLSAAAKSVKAYQRGVAEKQHEQYVETKTKARFDPATKPKSSRIGSSSALIAEADQADQADMQADNKLQLLDTDRAFQEQIIHHTDRIERNHEAIRGIERDIGQINEMFRDLNMLVQEQQGGIDNIETNVAATNRTTKTALKDLKQAQQHQKDSRCIIS